MRQLRLCQNTASLPKLEVSRVLAVGFRPTIHVVECGDSQEHNVHGEVDEVQEEKKSIMLSGRRNMMKHNPTIEPLVKAFSSVVCRVN